MNADDYDEMTIRAFDDLHRIAEALELIAKNGMVGQQLVEHLAAIGLHIGNAVRKGQ
jgi:hypothetical protein